jgi:hypothetical protein
MLSAGALSKWTRRAVRRTSYCLNGRAPAAPPGEAAPSHLLRGVAFSTFLAVKRLSQPSRHLLATQKRRILPAHGERLVIPRRLEAVLSHGTYLLFLLGYLIWCVNHEAASSDAHETAKPQGLPN